MKDVTSFKLRAFLPVPFTLEAYSALFKAGFGRSIVTTVIVGLSTLALGILVCSLAAFAFAKIDFPLKNLLFVLVLISFMVPFEAIAIPLYLVSEKLRILNTLYALILPGLANGLVIFLFRQFFAGIPNELLEAAFIDGASWIKIYWKIVLPLSKPALVSAGLLLFIFQWEAFMWPLIAIHEKNLRVIQVALAYMRTQYLAYWNQIFAGVVIGAVVPLALIFPLQSYYVRAITLSGLKE
ncbi:MAG: carbohydrate ABC transporter permease [Candidatus Caldatribacterium sp.]|nr:carbohydrate ABC transporter permease [Candidatus Caldatribacterium sp.]